MLEFTLAGAQTRKRALLEGLQTLGCTHIVSLRAHVALREAPAQGNAAEALAFLESAPGRWHPDPDRSGFDVEAVQRDALRCRDRLRQLADERDHLERRRRELAPWGDFELPDIAGHPELRFWFYVLPHYRLDTLARYPYRWATVHRDAQQSYVVVIAAEEPALPFPRSHTGGQRLSALDTRLAAIAVEQDALQAERASLARWRLHFARSLRELSDRERVTAAGQVTLDTDQVFAVHGWVPTEAATLLVHYARSGEAVLRLNAPADDVEPPTLLDTPAFLAGGERLLTFYLTPGYRAFSPAGTVLVSFSLFFAMILADAGYATLLATGFLLLWRRWPAPRPTGLGPALLLVAAASITWGVLTGSWFGLPPRPGSLAATLALIETSDATRMMRFAAVIGALHLALANFAVALHGGLAGPARAAFGWGLVFLAGAAMLCGVPPAHPGIVVAAGLGLGLVLLCAGTGDWQARVRDGLLALTRVLAALSDALSYLRLYALALSGAALAGGVNDIALLTARSGGAGIAAAALVLVLGHALNFTLGIAGGLVHGLRLNVIEFLNWSVAYEGYPFRPFCRSAV